MSHASFVYFIDGGCGCSNAIKIGKARNVRSRMAGLQVSSPNKLSVLAEIECSSDKEAYTLEKRLHRRFADNLIRGEWFAIPKATLRSFFAKRPTNWRINITFIGWQFVGLTEIAA